MGEEVSVAITRWKSTGRWSLQEKRSRVLSDLEAAIAVRDSTQLAEAMQRAGRLGILMTWDIDVLLAQEELQGTWSCLASALADADRFVLQFWLDEAKEKELSIPHEVTAALLSFDAEPAFIRYHRHPTDCR